MIIKVEIIHDDPEKENEFKAFECDDFESALHKASAAIDKLEKEERVF